MTEYGTIWLQWQFLAVPEGVTLSGEVCITTQRSTLHEAHLGPGRRRGGNRKRSMPSSCLLFSEARGRVTRQQGFQSSRFWPTGQPVPKLWPVQKFRPWYMGPLQIYLFLTGLDRSFEWPVQKIWQVRLTMETLLGRFCIAMMLCGRFCLYYRVIHSSIAFWHPPILLTGWTNINAL